MRMPHWLDEVFENGATGAGEKIVQSQQWKDALSAAQAAYDEADPTVPGGDPAQAAASAFTEKLGLLLDLGQ